MQCLLLGLRNTANDHHCALTLNLKPLNPLMVANHQHSQAWPTPGRLLRPNTAKAWPTPHLADYYPPTQPRPGPHLADYYPLTQPRIVIILTVLLLLCICDYDYCGTCCPTPQHSQGLAHTW